MKISHNQKTSIDSSLQQVVNRTIKIADIIRTQSDRKLLTIGMFDMVNSTSGKFRDGHTEVTSKVITFNEICNVIIKKYDGEIVKNLGDGTLAKFKDPLLACLTAINILHYSNAHDIEIKITLTFGLVEEVKINKRQDVFGSPVDKCFRLQNVATQNEVLLDDPLYATVIPFLKGFNDIDLKESDMELKSFGRELVHRIILKSSTITHD
jgi:class 3 adenylate cyclase